MSPRLRVHKESGSTEYLIQELINNKWSTLQITINYYEPKENRKYGNLPIQACFSHVDKAVNFAAAYKRCLEVPEIEVKFFRNCINTREIVFKVVGFNSTFDRVDRAFSAYNERRLEIDIEV